MADQERAGFFPAEDLERLAAVAFDTGSMTLGGPYTAVFDELSFGVSVPATATLEGYYGLLGAAQRNETHG